MEETFDLMWLQTLGGGGGVLRGAIAAEIALGVLETEQSLARLGQYGAGVIVYLRPSGPTEAEQLVALEAALTAQSQTNAELLRRLAAVGLGAGDEGLESQAAPSSKPQTPSPSLLSVAAFRTVLLDISDKGMTIRDLRGRLLLARKGQPHAAMEPSEVATYINGLRAGSAPEMSDERLVTDQEGHETLAEGESQ